MFGRRIIRFESVGSTNEELKSLAMEGAGPGTIVVSNVQSKGKGRMTRAWESPEGGLWMSILIDTSKDFDNNKFGLVPLMAGSAVATAIISEYELDASVKWPNDVMISSRKVCGILGEIIRVEGSQMAIVGIGVNVNNPVRDGYEFSQAATSIIEERGRKSKLEELENAIIIEMNHRIKILESKDFNALLDEWRGLSSTLGKNVKVDGASKVFKGIARDIDENGALILETEDGTNVKVTVGDCIHLD